MFWVKILSIFVCCSVANARAEGSALHARDDHVELLQRGPASRGQSATSKPRSDDDSSLPKATQARAILDAQAAAWARGRKKMAPSAVADPIAGTSGDEYVEHEKPPPLSITGVVSATKPAPTPAQAILDAQSAAWLHRDKAGFVTPGLTPNSGSGFVFELPSQSTDPEPGTAASEPAWKASDQMLSATEASSPALESVAPNGALTFPEPEATVPTSLEPASDAFASDASAAASASGVASNFCGSEPPGWLSKAGLDCATYEKNQYCTRSGGYGSRWQASFGSFDVWARENVSAAEACCGCGGGSALWTYKNASDWSRRFVGCEGTMQSPIALTPGSGDLVESLQYDYTPLTGLLLANAGHSARVNGSFGTLYAPGGEYEVEGLEFHFPSEHRIADRQMVGEMHIVHRKRGISGDEGMAIVAVFLQLPQENDVGNPDTKAQRSFFSDLGLSEVPWYGMALPTRKTMVDLNVLSDALSGHYWSYEGSLTAPPCSERVKWFVMAQPVYVEAAVVMSFKERFPNPMNNRPLQDLNGRHVYWA